jgi:hypothetical protein
VPCLPAAAPRLLPAYACLGHFDEILLAVRELSARDRAAVRALYPLAVSCLGAAAELTRMEDAVLEMGRLGLRVDAATGDAFVRAYAAAGTIPQMAAAYRRHKKTAMARLQDEFRHLLVHGALPLAAEDLRRRDLSLRHAWSQGA